MFYSIFIFIASNFFTYPLRAFSPKKSPFPRVRTNTGSACTEGRWVMLTYMGKHFSLESTFNCTALNKMQLLPFLETRMPVQHWWVGGQSQLDSKTTVLWPSNAYIFSTN